MSTNPKHMACCSQRNTPPILQHIKSACHCRIGFAAHLISTSERQVQSGPNSITFLSNLLDNVFFLKPVMLLIKCANPKRMCNRLFTKYTNYTFLVIYTSAAVALSVSMRRGLSAAAAASSSPLALPTVSQTLPQFRTLLKKKSHPTSRDRNRLQIQGRGSRNGICQTHK